MISVSDFLAAWSRISSKRFVLYGDANVWERCRLIIAGEMSADRGHIDQFCEDILAGSGCLLIEGNTPQDPCQVIPSGGGARTNKLATFVPQHRLGAVFQRSATLYTTSFEVKSENAVPCAQILSAYLRGNEEWAAPAGSRHIWVTARGTTLAIITELLKAADSN